VSGRREEAYVELHCRSAFSLLDGASLPEALAARAASLGYHALALTDRADLGGVVRFDAAAHECETLSGQPLGAIIGAELAVDGAPLVLLAESAAGYANLSTLVTRARMDRPRGEPGVDLALLATHAAGLFALTGCPRGQVPTLIARGDVQGARRAAGMLRDVFDGRLAVECWDHGLPEEHALVAALVPLARAVGVPWVVTNDVYYADAGGRVVHDVLACLRHGRTLDEMGTRLKPSGEWYLKSAAQLRRRWRADVTGLRETLAIAERCTFRLAQLRPTLPAFPLPPGVSADDYLADLVEQGASERWPGGERTAKHDGQLLHELRLIRKLGLAGYFLIVWDIMRFARREGILCQGRGSAANSAVCYCLAITAVDPIRMELLFERFLSEERQEAPDIDLDFAHRERERVIQYVYARYGRDHAAMVCEQITYRGRSAVRDAARVLGFSVEQAAALSAFSDRFSARATAEALRAGADEAEAVLPDVLTAHGPLHAGAGTEAEPAHARREEAKRKLAAETGGDPGGREDPAHAGDGTVTADGTDGVMLQSGGGPRAGERRSPPADHVTRALASGLVRGTEATTRARAVKEAAKQVDRPLTSADRPRPRAAYEPYGSPNAHQAAQRNRTPTVVPDAATPDAATPDAATPDAAMPRPRAHVPGARALHPERADGAPAYVDPHADDAHTERRNPTTALRTSAGDRADNVLARAGLDPADRRVRALASVVDGLHQVPRHRSIHSGGFVLTEQPLATVVPIEPASMPGRTVIQWEKDDLDPVGLVKIDLLGLGMLTVLQDCMKYVRETRGIAIDLARLDMTDAAVFDDLCRADTIGVFQVESRAQMNTLPRLRPRTFYDLVIEVALIRPGPIQGDMVHPFLRRRAGLEPVEYPHPSLEPILRRTLGVPLFQEQGMQVAIACAGFTPGEADNLRRAMGHKRSRERMAEICERLVGGMARNGIPEETAHRIYNQINAFADYGFPESHAASFALLVYASAYLKHHFAPEFTAAILNAQPMGFYAPGTLVEDARRHGVRVHPIDVTRSRYATTLEPPAQAPGDARATDAARDGKVTPADGADATLNAGGGPSATEPVVRLGLHLVRGLGARARGHLEHALDSGGPFTSIGDLVARSGLDRRSLRLLAECGALDAFVPDEPHARRRRAAIWRMLETWRGDAGPLAPMPPSLDVPPPIPSMSAFELTEADYRVTGVSLNGHPMRHLRPMLAPNGITTARDAQALRDGARVAVAGLVICRQRPGTAKGFVFLTLEDETGMINIVVTPPRFERQALLISTSPLLLVRGTLQVESQVVNVRGHQFRRLDDTAGAEHVRGHDFR
jgi:DNA polymerase III alpha subunit